MTQCFTQGRIGATLTGLCGGDASDLVCECPPSEIELRNVAVPDSRREGANVSGGLPLSGQRRSALESPSGVELMNELELNARNDNAVTPTALRFDNSLGWCQHRHANADRK
jgi:hypothetical protein